MMSQSTPLKSKIDCVSLPLVRLASPANSISVAFQNSDGIVARSTVLDMIKQIRIVLAQYAVDGCSQKAAVIVAGRNDRDDRGRRFQRRRNGHPTEFELAGRILLERPNRRPEPRSSTGFARLSLGFLHTISITRHPKRPDNSRTAPIIGTMTQTAIPRTALVQAMTKHCLQSALFHSI